MAVDVRGFVGEPDEFAGLYRVSNDLERKKAQQQQLKKESVARQDASTKFVTNYLDDKAKFTGTKYDPYTHELTAKALNQAMELIQKGASDTEVLTAINPLVDKAARYSNNAQLYSQNKKQALDRVKGVNGIDLQKLADQMDKSAFEGKDISEVDPTLDYADMVLRNGDVYNTDSFDEYKKNAKWVPMDGYGTVKYTDAKGKMNKSKIEITAPEFATSEKDADGNHIGFVPKFKYVNDGDIALLHDFGKGNEKVRVLTDDAFSGLPDASKAFLRQEAHKYADQHGKDYTDPSVGLLAKAIGYTVLKSRTSGSFKPVTETKEAPAPRISINMPSESAVRTQTSINDLHKSLDNEGVNSEGKIDVSQYVNGVTFLTNSKGKRISQPNVFFDPKDKTFTYTDDDGKKETVSFEKFKSIATPVNGASDIKFIEGFRSYNRNSDKVAPEPPKKQSFLEGLLAPIMSGIKTAKRDAPVSSKKKLSW